MKERSVADCGRLAELAGAILTCAECDQWSSTKPPEPFWVGPDYRRGGIVLLARNPADKGGRPLPPEAQKLLDLLRDSGTAEDFRAWADWRRQDMQSRWSDGKPWDQWANAFKPATLGIASPNELAWLNVLPARTAGNAKRPQVPASAWPRRAPQASPPRVAAPSRRLALRGRAGRGRISETRAAGGLADGSWHGRSGCQQGRPQAHQCRASRIEDSVVRGELTVKEEGRERNSCLKREPG